MNNNKQPGAEKSALIFDQLWCKPQLLKQFPGYRRCRKCGFGHPKAVHGCPTEKLKKDIDEVRLIHKDKYISVEIYRECLAELDQQVGEFLLCIEDYAIGWFQQAAFWLNTTTDSLQDVWLDAKSDLNRTLAEAECESRTRSQAKDPNRKRITILPDDDSITS